MAFCHSFFMLQYIYSYNHSFITFAEALLHIFIAAGSVGRTPWGAEPSFGPAVQQASSLPSEPRCTRAFNSVFVHSLQIHTRRNGPHAGNSRTRPESAQLRRVPPAVSPELRRVPHPVAPTLAGVARTLAAAHASAHRSRAGHVVEKTAAWRQHRSVFLLFTRTSGLAQEDPKCTQLAYQVAFENKVGVQIKHTLSKPMVSLTFGYHYLQC